MKRIVLLLVIFFAGVSTFAAISDEQVSSMNKTVDNITKKMYSGAFLSPVDMSNLIGIKIKLDDQMLISQDVKYAQIYYKLGRIFQRRGNTSDAIECYQVIVENFPDTALAQVSIQKLNQMGVKIVIPKKTDDNLDE